MREIARLLVSTFLAGMGKHITCGIAALLLLVTIGCARPKPVTIRHESTPSQSDVAMTPLQSRTEPVDRAKETAAKKPDKAAPSPSQAAAPNTGGKGTAAAQEAHQPEVVTSAPVQSSVLSTKRTGTTDTEEAHAAQKAHERELIEQITAQVTEDVRKKVEEEVRQDVMDELYREIWKVNWALKEKDKRLRFGGDIRLRYEADRFDSNNALLASPSNPTQLMNTQNNTSRFKYRVRFGAEAQVDDHVEVVIRLSTGTTSNPVSENNTMGNYMNKGSVVFDLAYIKWQPWKALTLYGGRMPNPWLSSDLVWAPDLNFEGLVVKVKNTATESWAPFLTAGAFPLQQYDFSAHNKWLLGGQTGLESTDKKGVSVKIGAAYYDYKNITGIPNSPSNPGDTNWTAPLFQQKGNTLFNISSDPNVTVLALAPEYEEVNLTGILDIGFWDPVHVVFNGDYVKNIGFILNDVIERTGNPNTVKDVIGEQFGITVGYPTIQEKKQWRMYASYKRLGADAVVDAFTDPDFHLGGTNAKGWILGADLGLAKNYWLRARWLTANEISGPPLAIDVLQVDVNARF
ncbi:MAG TPA: putative porin [Nitrospirota bacterium]|nr:putative porin [Nitrospirota bacterium]